VRRFLREFVSTPDLIFDLRDPTGRVALALCERAGISVQIHFRCYRRTR
jgi:hypothetical protein